MSSLLYIWRWSECGYKSSGEFRGFYRALDGGDVIYLLIGASMKNPFADSGQFIAVVV